MTLSTRAEATAYGETSSHADVMAFLTALAERADRRFHLSDFGTTPGGRTLPLCVLSADGYRTPEEAAAGGKPIVLWINGIHAGEVEGKESAQMMMRDFLDGAHADVLVGVTLVVVPLYNPDGNDAFDAANRRLDIEHLEGQCGPLLVGTRVNAGGVNLNRDYLRQAAPESRALRNVVVGPWAPHLTIDSHATNGSVHRMAMTYDVPHTGAAGRPEPIAFMRERVLPDVTATLAAEHGVVAGWYGNFAEDERALDARTTASPELAPTEGWMTYTHHPRFGSNYRGLTGRLDLLLECYSYQPFDERVHATYATVLETLRWVAANGDDVQQVVAASAVPRDRVAVRMQLEASTQSIEVPTFAPRTPDGAPVTVTLPYLAEFVGSTVVDRPAAYLVPADVAERLRGHGLTVSAADAGSVEVEVATITGYGTEGGRKILESAEVGEAQVEWRRATRSVPDGWMRVSTDQPLGAVAVYLCEPESDDGAIENDLVIAPEVGAEFPIWRAH